MSENQINQNQNFEPSYRYPEAARMLQISEETLRRWVSQNKIGRFKCGGRVTFARRHLEEARRELLPQKQKA